MLLFITPHALVRRPARLGLRPSVCANVRHAARVCRRRPPVSCSKDGAAVDGDARLQLWREVAALRKSLTIAVNAERFADAARLRDEIEQLRLSDDYVRVETELNAAVADQRFSDAARLRDELQSLDPPPPLSALGVAGDGDGGGAASGGAQNKTSRKSMADMGAGDVAHFSETNTGGIVIRAESFYDADKSIPAEDRYQFGYVVKITNNTTDVCQLVSRHWIISSSVGTESEVKGPGVVGRQPVLEPGGSFEYQSQCPLTVPLKEGQAVVGNMRGQFHFCKGATGDTKFSADIDPFYFKMPPPE